MRATRFDMTMRARSGLFAVPLLLFAACGGNPLAGCGWHAQAVQAPVKKLVLEFDDKTDRTLAHIEDPDHRHADGHYTFDAATGAVTVTSKLLGDGKAETWSGKLVGESLELAGGSDTLKFVKGVKPH
jgi:hypothetical protein